MSSELTTYDLLWKCKRFIQTDLTEQALEEVIKDAIITASREIGNLGGVMPMAWNRETYDEMFTRYYASVSNVTQANPGVITADSVDPDLTSDHGFTSGTHFVYISGFGGGMERLNQRLFRLVNVSDTTFSLKTLDGQTNVNTTNYEEYSAGGTVYHAGIVLPASTIEPGSSWTIKRVWNVTFDSYPADPTTEERFISNHMIESGGRPEVWRYQKYTYSTFEAANIEHWLFWPPVASRYNVGVKIEKTYPDISRFSRKTKTYPPHFIEIHDYIWHRALSNLATQAEKQRRQTVTRDGVTGDNTKIEIVNAQYWILKSAQDEVDILAYNRSLLGFIPKPSGGMSA